MLITELELDKFRSDRLKPEAIISEVENQVQVLFRIGVGVGKSEAADRLLLYPGTYRHFDLVVYAAPTRGIINERTAVADPTRSPVRSMVLRPRPTDDCGDYAEDWRRLEGAGCSALAKGTLCRSCQSGVDESDLCFWLAQFGGLSGYQLVFTTEQQLVLNRSLISMLKARTGANRVLVILDEARLLDAGFEVCLRPRVLDIFRQIVEELTRPRGIPSDIGRTWCQNIEFLLTASSSEVSETRFNFPDQLNRCAFLVQSLGVQRFGERFRYLGYDLALLQWARSGERWKDDDGVIHFTARPTLNCHVAILSAHLDASYVAHRFGKSSIRSPFENHRFQHTGTRVLNLRNRVGADSYFKKNHRQILNLFAVLILRNIAEGRTTLLISRKKTKKFCASYLTRRLADWGVEVNIILDNYPQLPEPPTPTTIPFIHYGILGVNDFTEYESAYCLNSFYIPAAELNRHMQEAEPEEFRVKLKIVSGPEMKRRVEIEDPDIPDLDHTGLGNIYLRKLEVDPVIQAAGRVRFLTRPREVVIFQMHDLTRDVGECRDARSLVALRELLKLPSAKEIDRLVAGLKAQRLLDQGLTAETAAATIGVSRRTLFRCLQALKSAKNPNRNINRFFGTLQERCGGDL